MQALQRRRCQTRTRLRKKACVYGVRVSGTTIFRYIGDTATYIARYDDLVNGKEEKIDLSQVDVSMNGIELQDREFFAAIREGREPNASVAQVLPCYQVLHDLEQQLV